MAQNMAAQDKFVELMMLLFGGMLDKILTLKEYAEMKDKIEGLGTHLYDTIDTKITTAMPAEMMAYQALSVVSRNNPGYEPVFDCKYFADKFEENSGVPLTTVIMENDNYTQEQKEEFCKLFDSLANEKKIQTLENGEVEEYISSKCFDINNVGLLISSLMPYMNKEDQKGFEAVMKDIEANKTGDKNKDMEYVRNLIHKEPESTESKFNTVFRGATNKEGYAKDLIELTSNSKGGISGQANAKLNDMNFAAIQTVANQEKITGLRTIMDKLHVNDLKRKHQKLFDVGKLGILRIGTELIDLDDIYKVQVSQEEIIRNNDMLQKYVDVSKSKKYQDEKAGKVKSEKNAEAAQKEKERQEEIDNQVKEAKERAEELRAKVETDPMYKNGLGKKELDRIDGSLSEIETQAAQAKSNKESPAKFVFSDTKDPEVRQEIKEWTTGKYSSTKTINEFIEKCDKIAPVKESALEAKDACLTSVRFNRSNRVKGQMEKVVRENSMNLATTIESLENSKYDENKEEVAKQIAQLKEVVDERRDYVNVCVNNLKEYERGIVNADTMFACNVFMNDDIKKMEQFITTAPKEEVEKAFEKLEYIEENELLAVSKTRERALLMVEKRPDRNTLNIAEKKQPKIMEEKPKDNSLQRERGKTDNQ